MSATLLSVQRVVLPFVSGKPEPQGSTKAFYIAKLGRAIVTSDNRKVRPWRDSVADAGWQAAADLVATGRLGMNPTQPTRPAIVYPDGALRLELTFYLARPKSAHRRITRQWKKPDLSKLVRAVEDALTGILWTDDAQVAELAVRKVFGDSPGLEAQVEYLGL